MVVTEEGGKILRKYKFSAIERSLFINCDLIKL